MRNPHIDATGALTVTLFYCGIVACSLAAAPVARPRHVVSGGLFTAQQAASGRREYAVHCANCHGVNLEGTLGGPLKGPAFYTLGAESGLRVGEFFRFVANETPVGAGGSLSRRQYVEILAFILHENGYSAGSEPLTYEAALRSRVLVGPQHRTAAVGREHS